MSVTVRAVIRADKYHTDKNGLCHIEILVTLNRKLIYIKSGKKVKPESWEQAKVIGKYPNASLINAYITQRIQEIEAAILTLELEKKEITEAAIKSIGNGESLDKSDFHAHAHMVCEEEIRLANKAEATMKEHRIQHEKLQSYAPSLTFSDITPVFLTKYYKWLMSAKDGKPGNCNNTTIHAFNFIRMVFNDAKSIGITKHYPFDDWKIPKYATPPTNYLTAEERERIKNLLVKNKLKGSSQTICAYFLLECYSGIRHSDWGKFKVENTGSNEVFYLRTTKTNERITIPLADYPDLRWIVNYIRENKLTYSYSLQEANRCLGQTIAVLGKIDKRLTTHIGRHSAGTNLLELGLSVDEVALVLGVSHKVVNTYARITGMKLKIAFKRLGLKG